ncbi:MAG: hypothetical protein JNL52_02260 [Flavobacteriales bacterium]|nr:hypothetical protein [Flavobacteriales bacterium]
MDRERLTRLIKDPGTVDRTDLGDLRTLTERYPWFSGAQLLQAKGQHASGDVLYDETLQRTAAQIPSRTQLFDLVNTGAKKAAPLTIVPKVEVAPETITPMAEAPSPMPSVPVELIAAVEPPMAVPEPALPEPPEPRAAALVVPEQTEEVVEANSPEAEEDPLERQILEAAFASAYDLTLLAPPPPPAPRIEEQPTPAPTAPITIEPVAAAIETPVQEPAPVELRPAKPLRGRMRFTDWLDAEASQNTTVEPSEELPSTSVASEQEAMPLPVTSGTPKRMSTPEETSALIDRFMQQETPEPKPKAAFYTPQQAAKKSLDDTAGMVTETLARIYEKQGNLPKAIDAYHRLALKYPEKGAYFAALAKALEEQSTK